MTTTVTVEMGVEMSRSLDTFASTASVFHEASLCPPLNRSTNNKQMDLRIRYWAGDCVQSLYFGSQFLGHATAQDLLHNFMVSFMHAQSLILSAFMI